MSRLLAFGLVLFAAALGAPRGASAPVPALAGKPLPPELALIPHDAAAVYTTRTRAALAALPAPAADAQMHPEVWLVCVIAGIAPEDVERFTLIVPPDALPPQAKDDDKKRPRVSPDPVSVYEVPPEARYHTFVLTSRKPITRLPYQAPFGGLGTGSCRAGRTATHRGRTFTLDDDGWSAWLKVGDRTVVFGTRASVEWVIDQMTGHAKPGPLEPAIWAIRDNDLATIVRPAIESRQPPADFLASVSTPRGRVITEGLKTWSARLVKEAATTPDAIAVGTDIGADRITIHAAYATEKAAGHRGGDFKLLRTDIADLAAPAREMLLLKPSADESDKRQAAQLLELSELLRPLDKATANGRIVSTTLPGLAAPLLGDTDALRIQLQTVFDIPSHSNEYSDLGVDPETYREAQVVRALEAYHAKHGRYPDAATAGKDGKPLLSWRVELLPYLGFEKLYQQFNHEEPWDSAHNAKLLNEIPWPYSDGTSRRFRHRPTTRLFLPVGPGTMFEGGKGRRKADASDGADQTILLLKLDRAVPWTKPEDAEVATGKPLKVGGDPARLCGFSVVDSKSRSLDQFALLGGEFNVAPLLTRAGGEAKIDIDKTISAAVLAAGHDKLNVVEMFERIFKRNGIEIPSNLPPPRITAEP